VNRVVLVSEANEGQADRGSAQSRDLRTTRAANAGWSACR